MSSVLSQLGLGRDTDSSVLVGNWNTIGDADKRKLLQWTQESSTDHINPIEHSVIEGGVETMTGLVQLLFFLIRIKYPFHKLSRDNRIATMRTILIHSGENDLQCVQLFAAFFCGCLPISGARCVLFKEFFTVQLTEDKHGACPGHDLGCTLLHWKNEDVSGEEEFFHHVIQPIHQRLIA